MAQSRKRAPGHEDNGSQELDLTTRCCRCKVFAYFDGYEGKVTLDGCYVCTFCVRSMSGHKAMLHHDLLKLLYGPTNSS